MAMGGDDEAVRVQAAVSERATTAWSKEQRGCRHNLFAERVCGWKEALALADTSERSEGGVAISKRADCNLHTRAP